MDNIDAIPPAGSFLTTASIWTAVPVGALALLALLYVVGVARAYRAAGPAWSQMDRDVRLVFLLTAPLFRAGVALFIAADRLFYRPRPYDQQAQGNAARTAVSSSTRGIACI